MIVTGIVRLLQLIFSIIAIGLSIAAVRWQEFQTVPANGYAAFASAFGILAALLGLVAIFVSSFPGLIMAGIDFLAFIILLAAGITYAVKVRGVNCDHYDPTQYYYSNPVYNELMNGGLTTRDDGSIEYAGLPYDANDLTYYWSAVKPRCQQIIADDVFLFLACIMSLAAGVLAFMAHRRGGGRSAAV